MEFQNQFRGRRYLGKKKEEGLHSLVGELKKKSKYNNINIYKCFHSRRNYSTCQGSRLKHSIKKNI